VGLNRGLQRFGDFFSGIRSAGYKSFLSAGPFRRVSGVALFGGDLPGSALFDVALADFTKYFLLLRLRSP